VGIAKAYLTQQSSADESHVEEQPVAEAKTQKAANAPRPRKEKAPVA